MDPIERTPDEEKREIFESEFARLPSVFIHLDARKPGVVLPNLTAVVTLQYGADMPNPIRDLAVNEWGVRATLSFNQNLFATAVPWSAVFGVVDENGTGYIWEADMPAEAADPQEFERARTQGASDKEWKRRHLKSI